MADEAVATGTPRGLTVDERNKPILDVVGDQAVGRTAVGDLGAGRIELQGQTVQPEEELTTAGKTFESSSLDFSYESSKDTTINLHTGSTQLSAEYKEPYTADLGSSTPGSEFETSTTYAKASTAAVIIILFHLKHYLDELII